MATSGPLRRGGPITRDGRLGASFCRESVRSQAAANFPSDAAKGGCCLTHFVGNLERTERDSAEPEPEPNQKSSRALLQVVLEEAIRKATGLQIVYDAITEEG